jgi:RHS repeat-associated protein
MIQPGRKYSSSSLYRYGFNGKENDNEVKGEGNQQDYGMRIYDPRLGKFLSVDHMTSTYPMLTPYQFASNRPIDGSDLDGNEWTIETTTSNAGTPQQTVTNILILRVKVENQSKIVTDAAVIKAKAEVYKKAIEEKFKTETTEMIGTISTKVIYKTEVILDYNAPSADDPGSIGHLIFDDRKSITTTTVEGEIPIDKNAAGSSTTISNVPVTTNTSNSSTPGDTRGEINNFTTRIEITMDGKVVKDKDIANTSIHEGGHSGGLNHPWVLKPYEISAMPELNQQNSESRNKKIILKNFMNSSENKLPEFQPGKNPSEVLPAQIQTIFNKVKEKALWTAEEVRSGLKN